MRVFEVLPGQKILTRTGILREGKRFDEKTAMGDMNIAIESKIIKDVTPKAEPSKKPATESKDDGDEKATTSPGSGAKPKGGEK